MPASDLRDPEDRDATGTKVRYLYCPDCDEYSGGGVCRVCQRGLGDWTPPVPPVTDRPFAAIVCTRGKGCVEVVAATPRSMISANATAEGSRGPDTNTTQQEALL